MTECIQLLAVTQGMYLANIDRKIERVVENANLKQCQTCKAMKHAEKVEQEQHDKEVVKKYLGNVSIPGDSNEESEPDDLSWGTVLKAALIKPYAYVVLGLLVISPYSVEIIKTLCSFFSK